MSAEQVRNDESSGPSEEVIVEARTMGWKPLEDYKGNPDKWVDADKYVEYVRSALPSVVSNNKTLIKDVNTLRGQLQSMKAELDAGKSDLATMQEFYNEQLVDRVKQARADLITQIKEAKRDNDTDLETDLIDRLTQLTDSAKDLAVEKKEIKQAVQEQPQLGPELVAWMDENKDWFGTDTVRTNEAIGYGHIIRARNPNLMGKAFYDKVDEMIADNAPDNQTSNARPASKVAGSRGGATRGNGTQGRTYADLPAEAKTICDKYAKKFVNPNGQFKTAGDYQKHYIKTLEDTGYFQDQR